MATRKNRLLSRFPRAIRNELASELKQVELSPGTVLHRSGDLVEEVFFPIDCIIAVTATMENGDITQVGLVGNREMVGLNAFMGGRELNHTAYTVQLAGRAIRIQADHLLALFDTNKALRDVLLKYTQSYIAQLSQNVACSSRHVLRDRLARWLLEIRDRNGGDEVHLTHEGIAALLAVRRAGISGELSALEKRRIVQCTRASVAIIDPAGLANAACECYGVLQREYNRLLGRRGTEFDAS
jgi:CRP-like cAMP-binding protein